MSDNKYPQPKKCPVCKKKMAHSCGGYECYGCKTRDVNEAVDPVRCHKYSPPKKRK